MNARFGELVEYVRKLGPPAVAFSGGVDSSLVAAAAYDAHGEAALAVTVISELLPGGEEEDSGRSAGSIGIRHLLVNAELLGKAQVADNPADRCYYCKREVFSLIASLAAKEGLDVVLDGTNADDAGVYRPGLRALGELGVISPLRELGLTKREVRELSKARGLKGYDRPASPCLATRFPYGTPLTLGGLRRVGAAEEFIRSLGFEVVRVRDHGELARIEVLPELVRRLTDDETRKKIVAKLKSLGYNYVSFDLEGYRSGSMDEGLGVLGKGGPGRTF